MHAEVASFVVNSLDRHPRKAFGVVYDIGGRNVNGTPKNSLISANEYVVVDPLGGPGVDVVIDAADWRPGRQADVILCLEVLDHCARWQELIANMAALLKPDGVLILTCACNPRPAHSAVDGLGLREGEHYGNIDPHALALLLDSHFVQWQMHVDRWRGDIYATCWPQVAN